MNISVENLAPCKKLMRVEVEAASVDAAFDSVTKEFQKNAALPGFRPGKAPRDLVLKKYNPEITDEVRRKVIGENYRKAVEEKKLKVVGQPDIEEITFARGQNLQFAATIETAPEFELPEYKGLTVQRPEKSVTDADVERAIQTLAQQHVKFETVQRELRMGDVAVVNYSGTCDGKPITETAPTAPGLTEKKNFWLDIEPNAFIEGFAAQLVGATAGQKRTVTVDFPADFVTKELQNKKGVFEVEILDIKEKIPPPIDDELAKKYGAENLEKLREGVRVDLERELKYSQSRFVRTRVVRSLLDRVKFDLPETTVASVRRDVVYNIVRENTRRGISRDAIEEQKEAIFSAADIGAQERVRLGFMFQRIAENEKISVSEHDVLTQARILATTNQIPLDKLLKDLQKGGGIQGLYEQALHEKVLEFLENNAKIETVPAPAPAQ